MANVDDFVQALQHNLITPLKQLPLTQIKALDMLHDQSVQDFQSTIGQLYQPPDPFTGQASTALAGLLADYYQAESSLSAYMSDDLSERSSKLITFCQEVVADLEPQLKALQGTNASPLSTSEVQAPVQSPSNQPQFQVPEDGGGGEGLGGLVMLCIVGTITLWATAQQEWQVWQAYDTMHHWEMNMSGLALYHEAPLPPTPSQIQNATTTDGAQILLSAAKGSSPVDPQRRLSSLSQIEWNALKQYLAGKYGCSTGEIQAIVNKLDRKQLTVQQLEIILQVLSVKGQMQALINQMQGYTIPGLNRLLAQLEGDINAMNDPYSWSQQNVTTWLAHLQSVGAEWNVIQALGPKNITGLEVRHPGLNGQVDFETADGTWYESKMEGNIDVDALLDQLEKYARAGAPALGIVVPENAPQNIGWLLLQRLRNDGFTKYGSINVVREPPYDPLKPRSGWCSLPDLNYTTS